MAEATLEQRIKGEARDRDDELILLLILISATDAELAAHLWDSLMPPQWRGLLRAEVVQNVRAFAGQLPPIWFDVRTQRYGLGNRGFITQAALLSAIDKFRDAAAERQSESIVPVYAGSLDLGTWQVQSESTLKLILVAVVAAAVGGVSLVTDAHRLAAQESLAFHLERLARFTREIEGGLVNLDAAQRRAGMYPESIVTGNYDEFRRKSHISVGFAEEFNILDPSAEHCEFDPKNPETPWCPELTERGWVEIGSLPPIGTRRCLWNCKCHLTFRRNAAEMN